MNLGDLNCQKSATLGFESPNEQRHRDKRNHGI